MKFKILDLNKPTVNDRIYTTEEVEKAIQSIGNNILFIEDKEKVDYSTEKVINIDMNNVIGIANKIYIEDETLYVEAEPITKNKTLKNVYFLGNGTLRYKDGKNYIAGFEIIKLIGEAQ